MASVGYVTIVSDRFPGAKKFYDALLASAGIKGLWEHPSGARIYGTEAGHFFCVVGLNERAPATAGIATMVGLRFDTRAEVDAFHEKAQSLGAINEGSPEEREPGFYMSYFRDPDGNKLCAYCLD